MTYFHLYGKGFLNSQAVSIRVKLNVCQMKIPYEISNAKKIWNISLALVPWFSQTSQWYSTVHKPSKPVSWRTVWSVLVVVVNSIFQKVWYRYSMKDKERSMNKKSNSAKCQPVSSIISWYYRKCRMFVLFPTVLRKFHVNAYNVTCNIWIFWIISRLSRGITG
jgi:hypothetical protein